MPDPLVEDVIRLDDVEVTVRHDGATVYAAPAPDAPLIDTLDAGATIAAQGVVFGAHTWLRVPWPESGPDGVAWIAGEDTDFSRSTAYNQVVAAWYDAAPVLEARRSLVQDLLRLRRSPSDQIAVAADLSGDELHTLEETLTRGTVIAGYRAFWALQERIGLPEPFDVLPVHAVPPAAIGQMAIDGFGPTTRAAKNGDVYYDATRGLSPGLEYSVAEGSPLIAVADGEIVAFPFLEHPAARSLALRPYLPPRFRDANGARVLSNVLVAYGNLMGDPPSDIVQPGDVVQAGQVIGTSGWPVYTRSDGSVGVQGNNAHLHLEVHLISDGAAPFGDELALNPLLLWTPRLVALQARLATTGAREPYPRDDARFGRLGFFTLGAFRTDLSGSVWDDAPTGDRLWPDGVYTLSALIDRLKTLSPYPLDGSYPI